MQDRLIYCSSPYPAVRIPFEVRRCSDYRTYEDVSVGEMKEIAWTLRTDSGGRKIGFKPPKKDKEDD